MKTTIKNRMEYNEDRLLRKKIPNILIQYGNKNKYVLSTFLYLYMNCNREGVITISIEELAKRTTGNTLDKRTMHLKEYRESLSLMMEDNDDFSTLIHINRLKIGMDSENKGNYTQEEVFKRIINNWNDDYNKVYPPITPEEIKDKTKVKDREPLEIRFQIKDNDIQDAYTSLQYDEYNYLTLANIWYGAYKHNLDTQMLFNIYMYIKMIYCRNSAIKIKKPGEPEVSKITESTFKIISNHTGCSNKGASNYCDILEGLGLITMEKRVINGENKPTIFYLSDKWKQRTE